MTITVVKTADHMKELDLQIQELRAALCRERLQRIRAIRERDAAVGQLRLKHQEAEYPVYP